MTVYNTLTLFLVLAGLAATPSTSVALVVVRSSTRGLASGVAAAGGIVVGDLVFVGLAVLGLGALAEMMGALFAVIRYAAAGYLVWFGIGLIRGATRATPLAAQAPGGGLHASFLAGLTLTLGDIKAILFYASLFPAIVSIPSLGAADLVVIAVVTLVAVGGVKIIYALAARAIVARTRGFGHERPVRLATGGLMMGAAGFMLLKG